MNFIIEKVLSKLFSQEVLKRVLEKLFSKSVVIKVYEAIMSKIEEKVKSSDPQWDDDLYNFIDELLREVFGLDSQDAK